MDLLLLEDDANLGQILADHLVAAGHRVCWCKSIATARQAQGWVMALMDLNLPDGDGLTLLQDWRAAGAMPPVIVLSSHDQVSDRVRVLQAGADDCLVKPFNFEELLARVDAVARRCAPPAAPVASTPSWCMGLSTQEALCDGRRINLTRMEWAVLTCLTQQPGRICSRREIEGQLHDLGVAEASSNSLEVIVSRLRKKLGGNVISTHRGLGYRFER